MVFIDFSGFPLSKLKSSTVAWNLVQKVRNFFLFKASATSDFQDLSEKNGAKKSWHIQGFNIF